MDRPSSLNSAFCDARSAVGEPAQGVGSGGLFTVVLLKNMMLWLNSSVGLFPVIIAHTTRIRYAVCNR